MKYTNLKNITQKLKQYNQLTAEEEHELLADPAVTASMHLKWQNAPDATEHDNTDANRLWNQIQGQLWRDPLIQRLKLYKVYAAAATVLLFISLASLGYLIGEKDDADTMFIVKSGLRSMESVRLPDGTNVQIGPGSTLTYPSSFTGKTRDVKLNGQAFFDVAKNPSRPFIVQTSDMTVQALGTAFELFSYAVDNRSEVILLNGKVKIGVGDRQNQRTSFYLLDPDEKLLIDKQGNKVTKWKVDADKYTSWRKQWIISFENEKLSMIIPRLEQWYGQKIMCQKDLTDRYRFTFKIRDESLDRILFMMSESSPLQIEKMQNGNYMITQKK